VAVHFISVGINLELRVNYEQFNNAPFNKDIS